MAVQACVKAKMMDEIDEDDGPIVFKRSNTTSKHNQLNSDAKKSASQRYDAQSRRQASDVRSSNGQSSNSQKGNPYAKASPLKSPTASPKPSTSSARASPVANSKASTLSDDQSKHSSKQITITAVKEEKQLVKPDADSEDSEDDKPLSTRLSAGLSKGNSNHANKGPNNISPVSPPFPKPKINKYSDDSDDEIPLSSKFQLKSNAEASTSKSCDSYEKKPLTSKLQQNGSVMRDKKSSTVVNKRPLGEVKPSGQSLVKKPKLSDASTTFNSKQASVKAELKADDDDDDHVPISQRMKKSATSGNKSSSVKQKVTKVLSSSIKKTNKKSKKVMKKSKYSKSSKMPPGSGEGQKWTTLDHNGVIFPPPYKPHGVKMLYKGRPVDLTPAQEEVATMFAVMLDTDYMNKPKFKENFMNDWRKILGKNHVIQKLEDCDFTPIYEWHQKEKERKKQMSTEEKKALKEDKLKQEEKYMWAIVDGVKEKVGNFRVEPPGLFRGRGEHPKMGKLKKRIRPSDITINIGKAAPIPECPIPGESWKEIRHDNTVTWLAFWNDPINPREFKYVFLAASSSLKGQSDKEKYEKARLLKDYIQGIRTAYTKDFANKDVTKRQIAVATYLIDKLALRAGNEKDDDEADTVGCCTLKVENVEPKPPNILKFDFLGKDSIRYQNEVEVELPVYKAIQQFRTGKKGGDDLFDKLDTSKLNAHLKELMPGLTAKVFRTYNASITLDEMLSRETKGGDVAEKVVVYQHANKEVAIICNHQRSVSKSHSAQMTRLNEKIDELKGILDGLQTDLARAKKGKPPLKNADGKSKKNLAPEALERKIAQTNAKIEKMERDKETKEDLKTVALGTSKINYLDPRITVAWCKRHEVPIEKIFNKSLLAKFAWAMDVDPSFRF
uniref:DNA topoisomerase I n=1 Tax=Davidia involucrata TaxID=16924 RepID=A0A5B7AMX0_DAVIN